MLSTIHWTNRGTGPGAGDTDGFNLLFGANANHARLNVDRAIDDWEAVINDFNYDADNNPATNNTYSLTLMTADLTSVADGVPTSVNAQGKPTAGRIRIDSAGTTHWIDQTIGDDAEFTTITNAFTGLAPAPFVGTDFYATALHELGHCLGFVQDDPNLAIWNFLSETTVLDPVDPSGVLWAFNVDGGPVEATFTSSDDSHLWEGPGTFATGSLPWHVNDLMNSGRAILGRERNLISNLDATILRDAYDYSITLPSTLNNMYVNPSISTGKLTINASEFDDTVTVQRSAIPGAFFIAVNGFSEIVPVSQANSMDINTGDGSDTLYLTPQTAATITNLAITSTAIGTVRHQEVEQINIIGSSGNDTFTVQSTPVAFIAISGSAGDDTLFIAPNSQNFAAFNSSLSWNGGDDADKLQFNNQTTNLDITYDIRSTGVELTGIGQPLSVSQIGFNYFSDSVVINSGNGYDVFNLPESNLHGTFNGGVGNDSFIVGGGNVGTSYTSATLSGGAGSDFLVLDDSLYNGAANWAITDEAVQRNVPGVAQLFSYAGFEGVGVRTGTGGSSVNNITTFGAIPVSVNVIGGTGTDNFFINNFANEAAGGPFGSEQLRSIFIGGGGFNSLIVNDEARGTLTYNLYPTRLQINEVLADDGDFDFVDISAMSITGSGSLTTLNVYGTPEDIVPGNQTTVFLGGGNDVVNVFPHDAIGNLTVTTNIGIVGESGTDSFTIHDTGSADAINYSISNPFGPGTQNIFGLGTGGLGTATIENLTINAGIGADTFAVHQYTSGTGLTINAGDGDDTLDVAPVSQNLVSNLTNATAFNYNGGSGTDSFNLHNANSTLPFTYNANSTNLQATASGYGSFTFSLSNIEAATVEGGTNTDIFNARTVAAGSTLSFEGGGASDSYFLGNAMSTNGIAGAVYLYGGIGADSVSIDDRASTIGKTLHVGENYIGAAIGDNLFGPGGLLYHTGIAGAVTIKLGSGSDTVYARPQSVAPLFVEANNPTVAAPGDWLGLAFANAANPAFTPGVVGEGSYTFDNAAFFYYSGFENTTIDDVAPHIVDQRYDATGVPTIVVEFSEDVSSALSVYYLELINTTAVEQVPFAYLDLAYDASTNTASFTFPGYPAGILPDGEYTAKIYGALTDLFGNALEIEAPFSFSVVTPPPELPGDYNRDAAVDAADYVMWRKMLGNDVPKYSSADGDGSASVGPEDHDIWAAQFGETLPPLGAGNAASTDLALSLPQTVHQASWAIEEAKAEISELRDTSRNSPVRSAVATIPFNEITANRRALEIGVPTSRPSVAALRHDEAILAWLSQADNSPIDRETFDMERKEQAGPPNTRVDHFDQALAGLVDSRCFASLGDVWYQTACQELTDS